MNALTVGLGFPLGALAGFFGGLPIDELLWFGGANIAGFPGAFLTSPSAIATVPLGFSLGLAAAPIKFMMDLPVTFFVDGILGTFFSGAFSQIFNVVGNIGAGLV
jgi:hypothetical protein